MRHKKKRRRPPEVELNLAAMLDMAFQLLTFFILTFRPSPVEGQVMLRMPPPMPVTNVNAGQAPGESDSKDLMQGLDTLTISVFASADGKLRQMAIGDQSMGNVAALERRLAQVLGDPGSGFDQVIVQVDSRLQYGDLMQVLDVCTRQTLPNGEKLSKLSFVEMQMGP